MFNKCLFHAPCVLHMLPGSWGTTVNKTGQVPCLGFQWGDADNKS